MGILDLIKGKKNDDNEPVLPQDVYDASVLEFKDIVAPAGLKIGSKDLNLSGTKVRTFFVVSYPRFLGEDWLTPIINMDKVLDISIQIHPVDTAQIMKKFQKKVLKFLIVKIFMMKKGVSILNQSEK